MAGRRRTNSYLHAAPGDLIHADINKLGRIPDGGSKPPADLVPNLRGQKS